MYYFNYDGKLFKPGSLITGPGNRGLRYGDGVFETIKFKNGQFQFLDEHFARLWKGMQLLKFDFPRLFTPDHLQEQILLTLNKNSLQNARIRLNVIRGDGGLYDATNTPHYIIETTPLKNDEGAWNVNGLHAVIYRDMQKMADDFANCKHNNFLPYIMAALYAKSEKSNDAILLNNYGNISDTTTTNIFLIKNKTIITPSLSEGCIAGIMRKEIIKTLTANSLPVAETAVLPEMLLEADEVFLTNAIYNVRWVSQIEGTKYKNTNTREIYNLLLKTNPLLFC